MTVLLIVKLVLRIHKVVHYVVIAIILQTQFITTNQVKDLAFKTLAMELLLKELMPLYKITVKIVLLDVQLVIIMGQLKT